METDSDAGERLPGGAPRDAAELDGAANAFRHLAASLQIRARQHRHQLLAAVPRGKVACLILSCITLATCRST